MKVILLDETTGVNPKVNEITQIGFTVLDDNMIVEEVYDELVGIENEENYSIDAMVVSLQKILEINQKKIIKFIRD